MTTSLVPRPPRTGQRVKHRYELLEVLGEGGQGAVYRARDLREGDDVAVKILHERSQDPAALERMFREANALVTLWGTFAVRAIDQGFTDDGCFAIVMEYLRGEDLDTVCAHYEARNERFPVARIAPIFEPVVLTLERAHQHGIIHRDLKPGNVFVLDAAVGGGVRVLDFGFAKFLRMGKLTAAGMIAGSPSYLAPETWEGAEADARVDVYAFTALVFRTLAGTPPFIGRLAELMRLVTTAERPSLRAHRPDLPDAIDDWVHHGLAIDRDARFRSVRALWNALVSVIGARA